MTTDPVWHRAEIESPCVKVCMIHPETGLCVGCKRTAAEITDWSRMTPESRRQIMAGLDTRPAAPGRRGGRAARRRDRN
ncbi:DUF1289 domain-containing protein [Oceanibium sediminis]|uniref:DUF1289 domain-containing protein n=1 Tax=Oceanibium sediminis TaxID=2026339 RepID=UPI000DD3A341|nr:DUF1289 domain-containing protein [Oceanibium sediminis]